MDAVGGMVGEAQLVGLAEEEDQEEMLGEAILQELLGPCQAAVAVEVVTQLEQAVLAQTDSLL